MPIYFIKQKKALGRLLCKLILLEKKNQVYMIILATGMQWHSAALSLIQLVMAWLATFSGFFYSRQQNHTLQLQH
jgi:hypothetical protein